MTKSQQRNFIITGAIGALVSFVALIVMFFLPTPFTPMNHFSILSGASVLSTEQLSAYKNYMTLNLTWDSLYLIGHVTMWFGYAALLFRENPVLAVFIAVLGFFCGWLDFTENEIRWAALEALLSKSHLPISQIAQWRIIFGLSFWALFLCALISGIAVLDRTGIRKLVCAIAVAGVLIAPMSYQSGFLPAFLWIIVWHAVSAVLLWSSRSVISE